MSAARQQPQSAAPGSISSVPNHRAQATPSASRRTPVIANRTHEMPNSNSLSTSSSSSVIDTEHSRVFVDVFAPNGRDSPFRVSVNVTQTSPVRAQDDSWGAHPMAQDLLRLGILAVMAGGIWWLFYSGATTYGFKI